MSAEDHDWNHTLILRHLMNAVRTRERAILVSYCRDLAERRYRQGFPAHEVCDALRELNRIVFRGAARPGGDGLPTDIYEHVTMTLRPGAATRPSPFEQLEARCRRSRRQGENCPPPEAGVSTPAGWRSRPGRHFD